MTIYMPFTTGFALTGWVGSMVQAERGELRERAQLLITNPDMLHRSILPVHSQFSRILAHLKYVVVDEGHAYKWVPLTTWHDAIQSQLVILTPHVCLSCLCWLISLLPLRTIHASMLVLLVSADQSDASGDCMLGLHATRSI